MDEFASVIGELEILELRASKTGARRLRGRFPYKKRAVLSDGGRNGGRPQKEEFAPKAFGFRVNAPDKEIHLLVGHDYNRPLASKLTNTLHLTDSDDALTFDADITPEIAATSYGSDVLAQIDSGLAYGISPGFRLPPPRRVAKPEQFTDEGMDPSRGMFNASIRTIFAALLYELSIVTRPAYKESTIKTHHDAQGNLVDDKGNIVDENGNIITPADQRNMRSLAPHWSKRWR